MNLVQTLVIMGISVNEAHQVMQSTRFETSRFSDFQDHFTSLHWACREGRAETAKYLVSAGADIDATNKVRISIFIFLSFYF